MENSVSALDRRTINLLAHLHRGGSFYFYWTPNGGHTGDKKRSMWFSVTGGIAAPASWLLSKHVYFGVNPSTTQRDYFQASTNDTIAAINCLYAEFDGKDFAKATEAAIVAHYDRLMGAGMKSPKAALREATTAAKADVFKTDQEHYKSLAAAHIRALPIRPSIVVASGGGYQCYWLLRDPFILADEADRTMASQLQAQWVAFVGGDLGAKDLRRVLRLPGSTNFKPTYAPNFPRVEFVGYEMSRQYSLEELQGAIPDDTSADAEPVTSHRTLSTVTNAPYAQRQQAQSGSAGTKAFYSLLDEFNHVTDHAELLRSYGYTDASSNRMMRPGQGSSPGVELKDNRSRHWSSNDLLYATHWRTPFDALVEYTFDGDMKAARCALQRRHDQRIATGRCLAHRIRNLTTARTLDALLDIAVRQNTGIIRAPFRTISELAGIALRSVGDCMAHLVDLGHISRIDKPTGGVHWILNFATVYDLDAIQSCSKVENPVVATSRKTLFTQYKAHDAFNNGGTRRGRDAAIIYTYGRDFLFEFQKLKAAEDARQRWISDANEMKIDTAAATTTIVWSTAAIDPITLEKLCAAGIATTMGDTYALAEGWRRAAHNLTASAGPGALRVLSTLDSEGDCTYGEIADYNDFTYKSTARYVADLVRHGCASTTADEKGTLTVSIAEDWQKEIQQQLRCMATYGLARSRWITNCQAQLRHIEDKLRDAAPEQREKLLRHQDRVTLRLLGYLSAEGMDADDPDVIITQSTPAGIQASVNLLPNSRLKALAQLTANTRFAHWVEQDNRAKGIFSPADDRRMERMRQRLATNQEIAQQVEAIRSTVSDWNAVILNV